MPQTERHVRLFRNGRNQALRIPREFELEGEEARPLHQARPGMARVDCLLSPRALCTLAVWGWRYGWMMGAV